MLLKNKTAIITGSNRGIGKVIAEVFAENGANILAHSRKSSEEFECFCKDIATKYKISVIPIYFELGDKEQIKEAFNYIIKNHIHIDILVNNAGMVGKNRLFHMTPIDDLKKVFEINFFSQLLITQYASRSMIHNKSGSIINISSIAAIDGKPAQLDYVSSKAAMIGATKKLSIELGLSGIRVNAIAPGLTETDMLNSMDNNIKETTLRNITLHREADPREIANVALFLASDLSSYITGQVIRVDGGM